MKQEKNEEYYKNLDKRTKEYKEWVASNDEAPKTQEELEAKYEENNPGLGDVVEKITEATGIKAAVKFLAGEDCGCDERKKKLNKLRFRKKPLCLNEEEYKFLDKLYNKGSKTIGHTEKETLVSIDERVFQRKYLESLTCTPCIVQIYKDLKEIYETYK